MMKHISLTGAGVCLAVVALSAVITANVGRSDPRAVPGFAVRTGAMGRDWKHPVP